MSEDNVRKSDVGGDELLAKLDRLEEDLREIEKAKRQQTMVIRIGLLLILLAILMFAWNLWNLSKSLMASDNIDEFRTRVTADMQDLLQNNAEVKKIQEDIIKEVLPNVARQVVERFKQDMPFLQEKSRAILENLQIHLENHFKSELEKALESSILQLGREIQATYPKLSLEKLETALKSAQNIFIEEVTSSLEKRIDLVENEFKAMDKTLEKFSSLEDAKKLDLKEREEIKLELIESILELAIYEINPEKGNKSFTAAGGAK